MPKNEKTISNRGEHKHKPYPSYWKKYWERVSNKNYWLKFWTTQLVTNRRCLLKAREQKINNSIRIHKLEKDKRRIEAILKTF